MDYSKEIELELEKQLQFHMEKDKLEETIERIKSETNKCIQSRKKAIDYLLDYRKKVIEEYKDDEDKIIEYFDHERYVKEETFRFFDKKLKELVVLRESPYFGKVTFKEKNEPEDQIYIGRFGLTDEEEFEPVIVDWRAPVASMFYAGKLGNVKYVVPEGQREAEILAKRQLITKNGQLKGMFDSSVEVKDDMLQMVLSMNSEQKLKDIIMTIQQEQDDVIRQPKNKVVVVNGVAGSGKTTIALHRVAYLIYNFRKSLQDKVMIFGPNKIFMEYISNVLPSLGEDGVKQTTFNDFALNLLDVNEIMGFEQYMEKALSEDEEFKNEVIRKTSKGYIEELDSLMADMNASFFKHEDVVFLNAVILSREEIAEMFNDTFKSMPLFKRSKKIKRIIFSKLKDARDNKVREINKAYAEQVAALNEKQRILGENDLHFRRKNEILEVISELIQVKNELAWMKNPDVHDIYNQFNDGRMLTQDDLAPLLYLKIKLEGFKLREEVKHVVIDEAQDYSLLQFKVLKELAKCKSFTIVGDVNQRLSPIQGSSPMLELENAMDDAEIEVFNLYKSYRSTRQIIEYANKYLGSNEIVPLVREGDQVEEHSSESYDQLHGQIIKTLNEMKEKGYENVAVICEDAAQSTKLAGELKKKTHINLIVDSESLYHGGQVIMPSYLSKGMEFDASILVMSDDARENAKLNYVMCTRALHQMTVFKTKAVFRKY